MSRPSEETSDGARDDGHRRPASVWPQVQSELRRIAEAHFRRQPAGHTLQPTALLHEAYIRLAEATRIAFNDRTHFLAVAARAMRRILVDHARRRHAEKRGGGADPVTLVDSVTPAAEGALNVLDLEDALKQLAELDERKAQVVELRVFAGLTIEETAAALGVSHMTVSSDWRMARAWLQRELEPGR